MTMFHCPMTFAFRMLLGLALLLGLGLPAVCGEEPAAAKRLTNEELKSICENLGFEPKTDTADGKINLLYMEWKQGTFQFVVYASIAPNGNDLIVQAPLKTLPAQEDAYGKELTKVLAKGFLLTPSHFVVDETRQLRLIRFVPNENLTPAKVRKCFADFTEQVRSSEEVWRCDRWEVKPTVVAKPVVPELEGAWKVGAINGSDVAARSIQLTFAGSTITFAEKGAAASPIAIRLGEGEGTIDMVHAADKIEKGRFVREGSSLKFAFAAPGGERPADFAAKTGVTVVELELVK